MKKTTYKSGVTIEVPDNTTLVIGIHNSICTEIQVIGGRVDSIALISELLVGALEGMGDHERAAALSCLRDILLKRGILGENVKMKVFYKNREAPADPVKALQDLLDEMQERLRKRAMGRG